MHLHMHMHVHMHTHVHVRTHTPHAHAHDEWLPTATPPHDWRRGLGCSYCTALKRAEIAISQ